jgi:hypothetical protein
MNMGYSSSVDIGEDFESSGMNPAIRRVLGLREITLSVVRNLTQTFLSWIDDAMEAENSPSSSLEGRHSGEGLQSDFHDKLVEEMRDLGLDINSLETDLITGNTNFLTATYWLLHKQKTEELETSNSEMDMCSAGPSVEILLQDDSVPNSSSFSNAVTENAGTANNEVELGKNAPMVIVEEEEEDS